VIVAAAGIDGHGTALALRERGQRILVGAVVQRHHDDAAGRGPEAAGVAALAGPRRQPAHVAMEAGAEIGRQILPRFGAERGRREAHGVEAERERLLADRRFGIS